MADSSDLHKKTSASTLGGDLNNDWEMLPLNNNLIQCFMYLLFDNLGSQTLWCDKGQGIPALYHSGVTERLALVIILIVGEQQTFLGRARRFELISIDKINKIIQRSYSVINRYLVDGHVEWIGKTVLSHKICLVLYSFSKLLYIFMSWFDVLKQWLKFCSNKMFSVLPLSTASASLLEKTLNIRTLFYV